MKLKYKDGYNCFIDFLKFIFSIIIVLYHSRWFVDVLGTSYFSYGCLAVDFYFIVTGYLMMKTIFKYKNNKNIGKDTLMFLKNKISKIFPYILISFLIGGFILYKKSFILEGLILKDEFLLEIFQLGMLKGMFPINSATWYISSMLIVLLFLYPLAIKFKENYTTLICPILLTLFVLIVSAFQINLNDPFTKTLFFTNGIYSGFVFILIGNITYLFAEYIKKLNLNKTTKFIITIIEIFLYIIIILTMQNNILGNVLFVIMLQLAISITFSNQSLTYNYCNFPLFKKLGHFGFIMYLNNIYVRAYIVANGLVTSYKITTLKFFVTSFVISCIIYFIVPYILKLVTKINNKIYGLIIK